MACGESAAKHQHDAACPLRTRRGRWQDTVIDPVIPADTIPQAACMDLEGWFVTVLHLVISDANAISKVVLVVQKWIVGKTGL